MPRIGQGFARHNRYNDNNYVTDTSQEQARVEDSVEMCYDRISNSPDKYKLYRKEHSEYLKEGLFKPLNTRLESLDCSRPWLTYWITHSLRMLGENRYLRTNAHKIADFLKRCSSPSGGYGGGPQQEPHLASTYAAVCALVTVGGPVALASMDRAAIRDFFCRMQQPDGSFTMHHMGEVDIRGVYCALAVAKLLNIPIFSDTESELSKDGLFAKSAEWVLSCQTYEGGFGAAPGHEAHGGYTFCGVASLVMLDQLHLCNLEALMRWVANKQLSFEGGFCGRTNKLVDGCYSLWNGAVIPIIQTWIAQRETKYFEDWFIDRAALQEYILVSCQKPTGGLVDKPGRSPDYYHTCYTLAGLSTAQHAWGEQYMLGSNCNMLLPINHIYNITAEAVDECEAFYRQEQSME